MNNRITIILLASTLFSGASVHAKESAASKFASAVNCNESGKKCTAAIIFAKNIPKVDPVCACPNPVGDNFYKFSIAENKVSEFKESSPKAKIASTLANVSWESSGKKIEFIKAVNTMNMGFKLLENGSFINK